MNAESLRRPSRNGRRQAGRATSPHGEMREAGQRAARPRSRAMEGRAGPARLRKCLQGRLEDVGRPLQDAAQRVPPQSARSQFTKNHGRSNGAVLLRRRFKTARRLRRAQALIGSLSASRQRTGTPVVVLDFPLSDRSKVLEGGHFMQIRTLLLIPALLSFSAAAATADTAPKSAHADIMDAKGATIGTAKIKAVKDGVQIQVKVMGLPAGDHGIHIHTVGKCEGPAFTTAGGHFNPTSAHHGINNTMDPHPHLGDLPNLTVAADGKGSATFVAKGVTLSDGANSLFHDGGTSIVIHEKADDLMSDPSGNSGGRIACGLIEK